VNKRQQQAAFPASGQARNGERGLTLIEVLVALSILAAVSTTFLLGMTTSSKAVMVNKEQITAESLAKSQMEYIKRQDYRVDQPYDKLEQDQIPSGYDIEFAVERLDPRGDGTDNDDALQKITITIACNGETTFTLEGYKCFIGQ
jgi:prepilin-type N-terminal cleavage/methylation domain-containing protein